MRILTVAILSLVLGWLVHYYQAQQASREISLAPAAPRDHISRIVVGDGYGGETTIYSHKEQ